MDNICRSLATHPTKGCFEAMVQMCVLQLVHLSKASLTGALPPDAMRYKFAQLCFVLHEVGKVSNSLGAVSAQRVNVQQLLLGNLHQLMSALALDSSDTVMAAAIGNVEIHAMVVIEQWLYVYVTILVGRDVLHVDGGTCRYLVAQLKSGGKGAISAAKLASVLLGELPEEMNAIKRISDPVDLELLQLIVRAEPIDDIFSIFSALYMAHASSNSNGSGDGDDPWSSTAPSVSMPFVYYGSSLLTNSNFCLACLREPVTLYRHLKKLSTSTPLLHGHSGGHARAQTLLSRLTRAVPSGSPPLSPHSAALAQSPLSLPSPLLLPSTQLSVPFSSMGPPPLSGSSSNASTPSLLPGAVIWRLRRLQPMSLHTEWIHVQLAVDSFEDAKSTSSSSSSSAPLPMEQGEVNALLANELLFSELSVCGVPLPNTNPDEEDGKRSPVHVPPTLKVGGVIGGLDDVTIANNAPPPEVPSITVGLSLELVSRITRLSGAICRDIVSAMILRMNTCTTRRIACLHAAELLVNELRSTSSSSSSSSSTPSSSSSTVSGSDRGVGGSTVNDVVGGTSAAIAVAEWERISTRYADVAAGLPPADGGPSSVLLPPPIPYEPPSLCLVMAALAEHDSFSSSQRVAFVDAAIQQLIQLSNALEVNRFAAMEPTTCLTLQRCILLRLHSLESLMSTVVENMK
jgi:hypothetical protein